MAARRPLSAWHALALLGAAAPLLLASPAHADDAVDTLLGVGTVSLALGNIALSVRDIVAVAKDDHPGFSWSLAEGTLGGVQAIGLGVATAVLSAGDPDGDDGVFALLLAAPTAWVATLAAHGAWGAIDSGADPGRLFGASPLIGGNVALTFIATGHAAAGRLPPFAPALVETLGAVPGTITGAYYAATDEQDRGLWAGLTAGARGSPPDGCGLAARCVVPGFRGSARTPLGPRRRRPRA